MYDVYFTHTHILRCEMPAALHPMHCTGLYRPAGWSKNGYPVLFFGISSGRSSR